MYTSYFGFKKRPFVLSPDPEFLYLSRGHDLAFTHLEYGLAHRAGFVALTGDIGTGKTTLLNYLLNKVDGSLDVAMLFNSHLDPLSLLHALAKEFEVHPVSARRSDLFSALNEHFLARYSKGSRCVIVVDEAQNLSLRAFEELRMLSNLDAGNDFLVQIVLVGQPQLRIRLTDPSLAQLTQRISVHYHLAPMESDEVGAYVDHRLSVAGYDRAEPLFPADTISLVTNTSKGVPRIINRICDTALTYAFADRMEHVTTEIVEKVIGDDELLLTGLAGHNGKEANDTFPKEGNSVCRDSAVPLVSDEELRTMLVNVAQRLSALEARVSARIYSEQNGTTAALLAMLTEERKRTSQYSEKMMMLASKHRELQADFESLKVKRNETGPEDRSWSLSRKFWRVFSGS